MILPVIDQRGLAELAGGATLVGLAFARHMPAPPASRPWLCAFFDTVQDLTKNNDRIGQRAIPVAAPPAAETNVQETPQ